MKVLHNRPIRFASRCALCQKYYNMHHRTAQPIRFASRCAMCTFVFLGQKNITRILAHRPIRFASRCAICTFVSIGQKKHTSLIAHRLANRIGRCAMCTFVFLGHKYYNMHHRTSTSRRQLTPVFDQTCLFTILPNISTTISGSQF